MAKGHRKPNSERVVDTDVLADHRESCVEKAQASGEPYAATNGTYGFGEGGTGDPEKDEVGRQRGTDTVPTGLDFQVVS